MLNQSTTTSCFPPSLVFQDVDQAILDAELNGDRFDVLSGDVLSGDILADALFCGAPWFALPALALGSHLEHA